MSYSSHTTLRQKKYSHGKFPSFLVNTNKMVEFPLLCYFTPQEKLQNEAILQQQHNHPQAALLELQGLARGQERMLLSCFFLVGFLTHIFLQKTWGDHLKQASPLTFGVKTPPLPLLTSHCREGVAACRIEPCVAAAASEAHGKLFGTTLEWLGFSSPIWFRQQEWVSLTWLQICPHIFGNNPPQMVPIA